MGRNTDLYSADFYDWCLSTATLIREGQSGKANGTTLTLQPWRRKLTAWDGVRSANWKAAFSC